MKIGVMTWFEYHNYGTSLQVVAMNHILNKAGNNPITINYHTVPLFKRFKISKNLFRTLFSVFEKYNNRLYLPFFDEKRECLFDNFLNTHLQFTKPCHTTADLRLLNNDIDCFLCGSDQIWSPTSFDSHYFLDFVNDSKKMLAYAPSLALPEIEEKSIAEKIKYLTKRFTYISTREKNGSEIISKLTNKPVKVVLDPTLLLSMEEWNEIIPFSQDEQTNENYLLAYMLGTNKKYWKTIYKIANKLSLKVKIVPVFTHDCNKKGCIDYPVGPEEFIKLIRNAKFVCTDSYHGTIFSILYEKNFCTFKRFSDYSTVNQNSRIIELLSKLKLDKKFITGNNFSTAFDDINFEEIKMLIENEKNNSLYFLFSSLESINEYNTSNKQTRINSVSINSDYCCGCGGCVTICPNTALSLTENQNGFICVSIENSKCVGCGKCLDVCPMISKESLIDISTCQLFSYKDSRESVLKKSASGGLAYSISEYAISNGYSIAGCSFEKGTQKAIFSVADSLKDLKKFQSSKYLQSDFSSVYDYLKSKRKLCVIALPCQIAAASKIRKDENILYVDLICHGVPSYNLYRKYQEYLTKKHHINTADMDINFRYKPMGWRNIHIYILDKNGNSYCSNQNKDLFYSFFEASNCYNKSCYECPYRDKSLADIRIGDYWGPRYSDDNTGVSMLIPITNKGKEVLSSTMFNKNGKIEKTNISEYYEYQQTKNSAEPISYDNVIKSLRTDEELFSINKKIILPDKRLVKIKKTVNLITGKH